ncbi:MAG TPA: hypothetical protein VII20_00900 [Roseiarcus sp.]|jgi:hypothetical protein
MKTPAKQPTIEPRELRDGTGWYALVTWGDRPAEQVGGFPSEAEAQRWIDHSAKSWVKDRLIEDRMLGYDRG